MNEYALTAFYFAAAAWAFFSGPSVINRSTRAQGCTAWFVGCLFLLDAIRWSSEHLESLRKEQPTYFYVVDWGGVLLAAIAARFVTERCADTSIRDVVRGTQIALAAYFAAPAAYYAGFLFYTDFGERLAQYGFPSTTEECLVTISLYVVGGLLCVVVDRLVAVRPVRRFLSLIRFSWFGEWQGIATFTSAASVGYILRWVWVATR